MQDSIIIHPEANLDLIIANYLANKPRTDYYAVTYRRFFCEDWDCDDITPEFLKEFTDEQLSMVRELSAQCSKEEIDLYEVIDVSEDCQKYDFLQQPLDVSYCCLAPQSVDLETIYHIYRFKYGYFPDGIEGKAQVMELKINLTDEEYSKLLSWRCQHLQSGFTSLRYDYPDLFEDLAKRFDRTWDTFDTITTDGAPTYVIEMTEIDEDVKKISDLVKW